MTIQRVVTATANPFLLGGFSKLGVTPGGGSRAGAARRASSSSCDMDMMWYVALGVIMLQWHETRGKATWPGCPEEPLSLPLA